MSGGKTIRREQEPPGERREVIVYEKMEEPSAGWEMETALEDSWAVEGRVGERCAKEESRS